MQDFADSEPPKDKYFTDFDYNNDYEVLEGEEIEELDVETNEEDEIINLNEDEGNISFVHRYYSFLENTSASIGVAPTTLAINPIVQESNRELDHRDPDAEETTEEFNTYNSNNEYFY